MKTKEKEMAKVVTSFFVVVLFFLSPSAAQGVSSNNSCQNVTCAANEECRLVDVQCFRAPCYPVPQCVSVCPSLSGCNISCSNGLAKDERGCPACRCRACGPDPCPGMVCFYGKAKDADGCPLCPCNQPCAGFECPSGTLCRVEKNATNNDFYAQCIPVVTTPPCVKIQCTNQCRFGFRSDSNGCRTCDCYDPCQGYPCPENKRCVLTPDDCPPGAECRDSPMPYCTDDPAIFNAALTTTSQAIISSSSSSSSSSCLPLDDCRLNCSRGRLTDANGCSVCQCLCDPDPCMGLMCMYGKMKDADGCPLCPCHQPCSEVTCAGGQECQVVQNMTTNAYYGTCVATVPPLTCAPVNCTNRCLYQFKHDDNNCPTCDCYDPCEGRACPENKHCVMPVDDCPPGSTECRDAPMPVCVDNNSPDDAGGNVASSSSSSSWTTASVASSSAGHAARGDESSLLQCCIDARVSGSCLPFCSMNITQLFQSNYDLLTGCLGYLGSYLKCVSGGRSFDGCCRSRGVSSSCVYLCSGDDDVDMSNVHQVTQCILTSSQAVADCFSSGTPDPSSPSMAPWSSSSSPSVPLSSSSSSSSSSTVDVCLLGVDPGLPCVDHQAAAVDRWYYSTPSRACALFRYEGCAGNGNSFPTRDACLSRCSSDPRDICPQVMCQVNCQVVADEHGCHTCSCPNDCLTQGCPENQICSMMPGQCAEGANCPLVPRCVSSPDVGCVEEANCTLSCPNGLMTDARGCVVCQCRRCDVIPCADECVYGRAKDAAGCNTCRCYEPCQDVNCVLGRCSPVRENSTGVYMGKCIEDSISTETTTAEVSANSSSSFPSESKTTAKPSVIECSPPLCSPRPSCVYGYATDDNGCPSCDCKMDPCQNRSCSNPGEVCQTLVFCPSMDPCPPSSPPRTVCVDGRRPCESLQAEYRRVFAGDVARTPQLNCDSRGQFKVTQCHGQECWCVNSAGSATTNKSSNRSLNCYNGNQILLETVRIDADYNVIKPEDGWKFKQQVTQQMAQMLSVDEYLITIMKYVKGSIVVDVAIATDDISTSSNVSDRLNQLKPMPFNIRYENITYQTKFDNGTVTDLSSSSPSSTATAAPPSPSSSPLPSSPSPPSTEEKTFDRLLLIVLLCVFVPIAFAAVVVTVWLACKICRSRRSIPPQPLKSVVSTEASSIRSESEKSFSDDYKSDDTKKVVPRDTEA